MLSNASSPGARRLRVAVIPEQFPRDRTDVAGIFTRDYIEAIRAHCDVTVVLPGTEGPRGVRRALAENGVEYLICTPALRNGGAQRQRLGHIEGLYRLGRVAPFLADVDLIHAHGAIFHGVPAVRLGRRLGVPVVLTIHSGPFAKLLRGRARSFLTRRTLEQVSCVCLVSDDLRRQVEDAGITPKRIEVTYNPVDTDLFRPPRQPRLNRRITFAGRLEEYKGGLRVARAFALIAERLSGWTLSIAGEGPERQLIQTFIDRHPKLAGRVELLGHFTRPELAALLSSSDFFVYPSRHETFGLVIAEAMSVGLPVIAADRTAPPEFVDHRHGVLVPPDDIDEIAKAMERLACELPRFDRRAIRQSIVDRFSTAAFGKRLLDVYNGLVDPVARGAEQQCAG